MKVEIMQAADNAVRFGLGDVVLICGEPYIIGSVGGHQIVLINLSYGTRWCDPHEVDDMHNIGIRDIDRIIDDEWCAAEAEVKVFPKGQ